MSTPDYGCTADQFWEWVNSCPTTYEVMGHELGDAVIAFSYQEGADEEE